MQEYKVVKGGALQALENQINQMAQDGWVVHGDFIIEKTLNPTYPYYQAMVREVEKKEVEPK